MKILLKICLLIPFISNGQIPIGLKIITWKEMKQIEFCQVVILSDLDTVFNKAYDIETIEKSNWFPDAPIVSETNQYCKKMIVFFSYGDKQNRYRTTYSHFCKINSREKRIEIEFNLNTYDTGGEFLEEISIQKIYNDEPLLELIPAWDFSIGKSPKYLISNKSSFILYGQTGDNSFEGNLYKKEGKKWERIYTGGYNLEKEPTPPLYSKATIVCWIRDHRNDENQFEVQKPGKYLFKVLLGFLPYEQSNRYGNIPFYSSSYNAMEFANPRLYIKEYFELSNEFEID